MKAALKSSGWEESDLIAWLGDCKPFQTQAFADLSMAEQLTFWIRLCDDPIGAPMMLTNLAERYAAELFDLHVTNTMSDKDRVYVRTKAMWELYGEYID